MSVFQRVVPVLGLAVLAGAPAASGQGRPDAAKVMAAQREAMTRLAVLDGEWRGTGWTLTPGGEKHPLVQTERVGPFLDGTVRVVEGRGYGEDGTLGFNAFGIFSYDLKTESYSLRSYSQGQAGDFKVTPTEDGFTWEIPAGPMTIRYRAVIQDGTWTETGDRIAPGAEPVRFFEMTLTRIGDSDWPAAGALASK